MKSVCIFCGSKKGSNPLYEKFAVNLGKYLAENNIKLVYGGGNIGLMGVIADSCLKNGGCVIGVITQKLIDVELAHDGLHKMHIVETLSERKLLMEKLSDAFIALPGGYGTLDEIFEMVSLNQLNIINKPVGIFNIEGYFDLLVSLVDNSIKQGFIKEIHRNLIVVEKDINSMFLQLSKWQYADNEEWLRNFKYNKDNG